MSRRASVNPSDQEAQARAAQAIRIADVGRIAHVHPAWPGPGGIPSQADLDARYVNITGDVMSGALQSPDLRGVIGRYGAAGGTQNLLVLGDGTGAGTAGYIGFYPLATSFTALGTRYGYVGVLTSNLILNAELATAALDLRAGASAELWLRRGATVYARAGTNGYFQVDTALLCVNASAPLRVTRTGSTRPYLDFYNDAVSARYGGIVGAATSLELFSDANAVDLMPQNGSELRAVTGAAYIGKTATNLAVKGVEIFGTHSTAGGSVRSTTNTVSIQNFYARHEGAAAANGQSFMTFAVAGGTGVGSITQNGASNTAFNTASDRRMKRNIRLLRHDEKLAVLRAYHPVEFEMNLDPEGSTQRGYIAQDVYRVNRWAVVGDLLAVDQDGKPIMMGVDYGRTAVDALAGAQAVDEDVQSLTARVAELETLVAELVAARG